MNNKGFTLVELLGVMLILGIVMGVTIPNISGISTQNKITTYAEDAKKFKSTAEYMIRGDDTVKKPVANGECVVVNLKYVHGNEYDNSPYGGEYLMNKSFVVMVKKNRRYQYYVQLVEKFNTDGTDNYRGFKLLNYTELEATNYLDKLTEGLSMADFVDVNLAGSKSNIQTSISSTGCTTVVEVYNAT